jgi:ligand-binding sensor domain-containing protein
MASKLAVSGLVLIGLGVALASAYQLGRSSAVSEPVAALPAAHAALAAPQREGKVGADAAQKFTHFRVGNKNVKRIHADGDLVWVGTSGGLVRYDTRRDDYKLYDTQNGLLSNGVFYVGALDGRIAVGTYGGGLALLDPKTEQWETFNVPEGLGDAFVYDVLKTKNGDVWIATWSGVNRVKGGRLKDRSQWELHTVESTKGGLPNDWVYGLAEGKNGEIWLGTEGGLARFAGGRWDNWNHAKGLGAPYERVKDAIDFKSDPARQSQHHAKQKQEMGLADINVAYNPNYIVALAVDRDGVVWAGTWGGGLSRFDGTQWSQQTVAEGLPGNHVFMLHVDAGGTLWIGTNKGLARPKAGGGFEVLTTHEGLFNDTVFSMTTGRDGTRWVGSFGGVARIKPS